MTDFDVADICKVSREVQCAEVYFLCRACSAIQWNTRVFVYSHLPSVVTLRQGLLRLQTLDLRACRRVGNKGIGHIVAA